MLDKISKHANKILFFLINVLLAAVAFLIIREKDQTRLLNQAENNSGAGDISQDNIVPTSLRGSLQGPEQDQPVQDAGQAVDNSAVANPADATNSTGAAAQNSTTTNSQSGSSANNSSTSGKNSTNTTSSSVNNTNSNSSGSNSSSNTSTKANRQTRTS